MDVFAGFYGRVLAAVQQLKHDGVVPQNASIEGITLEPPKDASHGDLATNAAMVLAKPAGLPPRALAERLAPLLAVDAHVHHPMLRAAKTVSPEPTLPSESARAACTMGKRSDPCTLRS